MTRLLALAALVLLSGCGPLVTANAPDVVAGHVVDVLEIGEREAPSGVTQPFERLRVELDESLYRGERVEVDWGGERTIDANGLLRPGDRVLLAAARSGDQRTYTIAEVVRLPSLAPIAVVFVVGLLAVARWKGLTTLAGIALSLLVVFVAIVPAVQRGQDPLIATLVASVGVVLLGVFVIHAVGWSGVAAASGALAGVGVVAAAGAIGLASARLTGLAGEGTALRTATAGRVDMADLALAAVVLASLGVIVDLAVSQAAAVRALAAARDDLRGGRLFAAGMAAAQDHVASLVNTFTFVLLGSVLPLALLLFVGPRPLAVTLNGEPLMVAAVALLAAGLGLLLSVPVTTWIAVLFAGGSGVTAEEE